MVSSINIVIDELILEGFDDNENDTSTIIAAIKEQVRLTMSARKYEISEYLGRVYDTDADFGPNIQLDPNRSTLLNMSDIDGGLINLQRGNGANSSDNRRENATTIGNEIGNSIFKVWSGFRSRRAS